MMKKQEAENLYKAILDAREKLLMNIARANREMIMTETASMMAVLVSTTKTDSIPNNTPVRCVVKQTCLELSKLLGCEHLFKAALKTVDN